MIASARGDWPEPVELPSLRPWQEERQETLGSIQDPEKRAAVDKMIDYFV